MTPEPQGLGRKRKIATMVAVGRNSDRPAVIFMITTYLPRTDTISNRTQNENPIEDRDNLFRWREGVNISQILSDLFLSVERYDSCQAFS